MITETASKAPGATKVATPNLMRMGTQGRPAREGENRKSRVQPCGQPGLVPGSDETPHETAIMEGIMTTYAVPAGTPLHCNRNQCNATFPAPAGLNRTAFAGSEAARTTTMVACPICGRFDSQWVFADDIMPKFDGTFDQRGKQRNAWKRCNLGGATMTKTQISFRVSPDTLAAIDAEAERLGISRGALIDRWLGQQAAAKPAPLIRLGMLIEQARVDTGAGELASALHIVCDVLDELAGTAPEEG